MRMPVRHALALHPPARDTVAMSRTAPPDAAPEVSATDIYWLSADTLRLHARDYAPQEVNDLAPVICLPGLTRNARDFDGLAPHLARKRRVLALDFRGRGESAYDREASHYLPPTYAEDVLDLVRELGIPKFVIVGTSLGGLVGMLIAAQHRDMLAGIVLNDVGPELETAGLDRIRGYVGQQVSYPTWVHCAWAMAEDNRSVYPRWKLEEWLAFAKRTHRLTPEGRVVPDYDRSIATPLRQPEPETPPDLWPLFESLKTVPLLLLRGAHSDILSADSAQRMMLRLDHGKLVTVPEVGHAPTLDEPEARTAIDALLETVP